MADMFLLDPIYLISTILIAFVPPIAYAIIIRYSEKFEREPWGSIFQAFLWGGTLGIILVILIRGFFHSFIEDNYPDLASDIQSRTFFIVIIITPIFAEIIKPLGLLLVKADILEAEDGLIYGAVIGLGYTATENLMYGIFFAPLYGIDMFITVIFMRSMSVMFIQSSTTALTCYGITRAMKVKHKTGSFIAFPLFLVAAMLIHAAFNYFSFMEVFNVGDILFSMSSSLLFSIIFAFILMITIYVKIYRLDRIDEKAAAEQAAAKSPERMPTQERPPARNGRAPPHRVARPQPRDERDYDYEQYDREPAPYPQRSRGPPPRPGQMPQSRGFAPIYEPPTRGRAYPPPRAPPPRRPAPYPSEPYPEPRRPPAQRRMQTPPPAAQPPRPPGRHMPSEPISPRPPRSQAPLSRPRPVPPPQPVSERAPPEPETTAKKKKRSVPEEKEPDIFELEEEPETEKGSDAKEEADVDWDM